MIVIASLRSSCFLSTGLSERTADLELKIPTRCEPCFDGLAKLTEQLVVVKCVEEGEIYVFDYGQVGFSCENETKMIVCIILVYHVFLETQFGILNYYLSSPVLFMFPGSFLLSRSMHEYCVGICSMVTRIHHARWVGTEN